MYDILTTRNRSYKKINIQKEKPIYLIVLFKQIKCNNLPVKRN